MEINFTKQNGVWVAEFEVTNHFNIHMERMDDGLIRMMQRGLDKGKYVDFFVTSGDNQLKNYDYDFSALVYPKYIKVVSGIEVAKAFVTCPDGEVTPIAVPTYEFVDLGLPSGTKWATCNLGATKPEEPGLYFAWGETEGYTAEDVAAGKKAFIDTDYKFYVEPMVMSKYTKTDGLTTLENVDDAAYYISDGLCKMPSKEDFEELIANTTATEETLNGVKVWKLTSKVNDAFIFICSSDVYLNGDNGINDEPFVLRSNSKCQDPADMLAYVLAYSEVDNGIVISEYLRCCGIAIRPIQN